jgi:hypothetical protein
MTPAMNRFRIAYRGLCDSLGRAPALCEVADALGVRHASADRTRDKLRLAGVDLPFSVAGGNGNPYRRQIVKAVPPGGQPTGVNGHAPG